VPAKHGEGRYFPDEATLDRLETDGRIVARYAHGRNPNGSSRDIAGVTNEGRNVVGLMPHPEHAVDPGLVGGIDGRGFFTSLLRATSMRGTLHLHTVPDMVGIRKLVQPVLDRMWQSNFAKRFGEGDRQAVVRAGRRVLDKEPVTANALRKALVERFPEPDPLSMTVLLQVSDILVQIPPTRIWGSGHAPVLARIGNWIAPPKPAITRKDLVLRYLGAFGPASVADMQTWCGLTRLDADFAALDMLYARGLRSVGIVWSRNNIFGNGVPFTFPGTPDHGDGLTERGIELVRVCNARGLMVDLSHLNEKGFWDVARTSTKPLVASHSNVHAIAGSPRNLTDRQLDAIAESKGLVGLNFASGFLREDGQHTSRGTTVEMAIRHLDYMLGRLGEDGVGIGSDFDGCTLPEDIGDASGLPNLIAAMERAGYGAELIARITHRNWIDLLERTWGR
jgi:microsomal dipeptidase-like Zn-dependent dipeptidase